MKSNCCKAPIVVSDPSPDFAGDNPKTMKIGTCHFICTKCKKACDPDDESWRRGKVKMKEKKAGDKGE